MPRRTARTLIYGTDDLLFACFFAMLLAWSGEYLINVVKGGVYDYVHSEARQEVSGVTVAVQGLQQDVNRLEHNSTTYVAGTWGNGYVTCSDDKVVKTK